MICQECRVTADANAKKLASPDQPPPESHPENCGCPCQHKPVGAWKGTK